MGIRQDEHSAGHGVVGNVLDGERQRVDLVGLQIGDLELELLLDGHHHLHRVQAVQPQILLEVCVGGHLPPPRTALRLRVRVWMAPRCGTEGGSGDWGYLGGVDLGVALEDVEDAVDDLVAGEVGVVGGHWPREPTRHGVGLARGGGERRRRGGQEADVAEDRRT